MYAEKFNIKLIKLRMVRISMKFSNYWLALQVIWVAMNDTFFSLFFFKFLVILVNFADLIYLNLDGVEIR